MVVFGCLGSFVYVVRSPIANNNSAQDDGGLTGREKLAGKPSAKWRYSISTFQSAWPPSEW